MTKSFTCDVSKVERLAEDLRKLHARGLPYAVRDTLNQAAYAAKREWPGQMKKAFTLRNRFTEGSIRVERAAGLNVDTMQSKVGSISPYMDTQESGGTVRPQRGQTKPIPTSSAAGQGMGTRPRTRPVQRKNWLSGIHLRANAKGGTKRENAIAIKTAAKTGGVAYLNLGRRKGLFRVTGGRGRMRVRMLWDMSKSSVTVKPHPTLEPTVHIVTRNGSEYAEQALQRQIDGHLLHKAVKAGQAGFF